MSSYDYQAARYVAAAVIRRAVKDVTSVKHHTEALHYLHGEQCQVLAEALGIDNDLARLVAALPRPPVVQLELGFNL